MTKQSLILILLFLEITARVCEKQVLRFHTTLKIFSAVFFSFLIISCATYKPIALGSVGHLSGTPPYLTSGKTIRVTLNNGETIGPMKVTFIDSARIMCTQRFPDPAGRRTREIIMVPDIQSIKIRKPSAIKTVGLVVIVLGTPIGFLSQLGY